MIFMNAINLHAMPYEELDKLLTNVAMEMCDRQDEKKFIDAKDKLLAELQEFHDTINNMEGYNGNAIFYCKAIKTNVSLDFIRELISGLSFGMFKK